MAATQWSYLHMKNFRIKRWFPGTFIWYALAFIFTYATVISAVIFSRNINIRPAGEVIFSLVVVGDSPIVQIGIYSIVLGFLFGALFGLISGAGQWAILRRSGFQKSGWLKSLILGCGLANGFCSFIFSMMTNVFLVTERESINYTIPFFFIIFGLSVGISTVGPLILLTGKQNRAKPLSHPAILHQ
jgi:hypothetical protein